MIWYDTAMFRASVLATLISFTLWIMPSGILLESIPSRNLSDHRTPGGCLCAGSSGTVSQYTKYVLQDACRGKPLAKFGGAAHNDLFIFPQGIETRTGPSVFAFRYSFLYDFHIIPLVEHVPKTTLS